MNTKTLTTKTLMDCASYCIMKLHNITGWIKSDKLGVNDGRIEHGSSISGHGDNGGLQLNGWIKPDKLGVNNGRIKHGSSISGHGYNGGLQLNELGKNDGDNEGLKNEMDMDKSCIENGGLIGRTFNGVVDGSDHVANSNAALNLKKMFPKAGNMLILHSGLVRDSCSGTLRSSFGTVFRLYSKSDNCSRNTVPALLLPEYSQKLSLSSEYSCNTVALCPGMRPRI
jgi:hypothetical protein